MNPKEKILNKKHNIKDRPIILTAVLFAIQLVILLIAILRIGSYSSTLTVLLTLLGIVLVIYIATQDLHPSYKLSWVVPMGIFPVFGGLLYIFIKLMPGTSKIIKKLEKNIEKTRKNFKQNEEVMEEFRKKDSRFARLFDYLYSRGTYPIYKNTISSYYSSGEEAAPAILEELERAEKFIFIEYFIIKSGAFLDEVLEILEKKAKSGVEVRLMYDGATMFFLPSDFEKRLAQIGIKAKIFNPIAPILSTYQNNRDHRKILVVDGKVAFTGGMNIADEYLNLKSPFGYWADNAIKIEGEAVKSFTAMFLEMYNIQGEEVIHLSDYTGIDYKRSEGQNFYIPYGDAPDDGESIAENIYTNILNLSKDYVDIISPYLILGSEMITGLKFTAKKGVKVRIIMPKIPDKKIPFMVARGYYKELIEAGVEIYEYTPGFIHSKVFVSDKRIATVGTVNLDFRSLYLHFENGVVIYGDVFDVQKDFDTKLAQSRKIKLEDINKSPWIERFLGVVLRVFGPLM